MTISETGAWIDDETGAIVFVPPTYGTQLAAPGCEIDPIVEALIMSAPKGKKIEKAVAKAPVEKRAVKK